MAVAADAGAVADASSSRVIPEATVARLAIYLRAIDQLAGQTSISSGQLAVACGVNSAMLRKDLSYLGSFGTRGVGYDVARLRSRIAEVLGVTEHRDVIIVGVGNLGQALAGYARLAPRGFQVVGLFDINRVGDRVGELVVRSPEELRANPGSYAGAIGVIATPAEAAQEALDLLVLAGITGVLNFAPAVLQVPGGVNLRRVDLASELQILSFHENRKPAPIKSRRQS